MQPGQLGELAVEVGDLGLDPGVQVSAGDPGVRAQYEELGDLGEGEPQRLRLLDQPEAAQRFRGVLPVPGRLPWGF